MRDFLDLLIHLIVMIVRLMRSGGEINLDRARCWNRLEPDGHTFSSLRLWGLIEIVPLPEDDGYKDKARDTWAKNLWYAQFVP